MSQHPVWDAAFPLPRTNSLNPLSLLLCVPYALERCRGEQAHGEGVTFGEQGTRLGVCTEGGQETTGKSCCLVLGAEETTGHWISASLA